MNIVVRPATPADAEGICAIYREQGLLDGKWVDTVIMELLL